MAFSSVSLGGTMGRASYSGSSPCSIPGAVQTGALRVGHGALDPTGEALAVARHLDHELPRCHLQNARLPGSMVIPRSSGLPLLLLLASTSSGAGESSPSTLPLGERTTDSDPSPISSPLPANDSYVENSIASVGNSISDKGGPFQLNQRHGKSILKARSEFQCE